MYRFSCFSFLFSVFAMTIRLVLFFSISFHFSSSAFVLNSFLLRICVYFLPLLLIPPPPPPFFSFLPFWRVSSEGGFSFFVFIFALGASVSECVSDSFGRSGYSLYHWQGRRFHPKRPFLPSTKGRPSEIRAIRDRYP